MIRPQKIVRVQLYNLLYENQVAKLQDTADEMAEKGYFLASLQITRYSDDDPEAWMVFKESA